MECANRWISPGYFWSRRTEFELVFLAWADKMHIEFEPETKFISIFLHQDVQFGSIFISKKAFKIKSETSIKWGTFLFRSWNFVAPPWYLIKGNYAVPPIFPLWPDRIQVPYYISMLLNRVCFKSCYFLLHFDSLAFGSKSSFWILSIESSKLL